MYNESSAVNKSEDVIDSISSKTEEYSEFVGRHIGPNAVEISEMLSVFGFNNLEEFSNSALPESIKCLEAFGLSKFSKGLSEKEAIKLISSIAKKNQVFKSYIGMGYADCLVPAVIQRNILENPGWYTQYTPYQPEISQGRLEALLHYQTLVSELTGLPVANASLLDEGTAAAEAMTVAYNVASRKKPNANVFLVSEKCHPQSIAVVKTRAKGFGIEVKTFSYNDIEIDEKVFGVLLQYPDTEGSVEDFSSISQKAKENEALSIFSCDPLSLVLLKSPAELGADIAVGNMQRFGVPYGYGGPHAAFYATKDEYKRLTPGRIIGVSVDKEGKPALRLALQTREQHIRREKATSNICTAQVLLAVMSAMYAVYHGPRGLKAIAKKVNSLACEFKTRVVNLGFEISTDNFFDTVLLKVNKADEILNELVKNKINARKLNNEHLSFTFDEASTKEDVEKLIELLSKFKKSDAKVTIMSSCIEKEFLRTDSILEQDVFNKYTSETNFLRYVRKLESRDLSLGYSMIPLGSCTMKLNATSEMLPVTWPEFSSIHPYVPSEQSKGYLELFNDLEVSLAEITGFHSISLQPNAGSQGEFAGLMVIKAFYEAKGESGRNICLIPVSAHGTNPASAVMAGMKVVPVACDKDGNVDVEDLKVQIEKNKEKLAALMVTYPSTHGVFEESIKEICELIHNAGGQVYLDGANMNALVGLSKVAELGADVCHINLHKTFCIPHGGGGPGMGPIGVVKHLADFLPDNPVIDLKIKNGMGAVSAAPWGSASILPISWMYIAMMGAAGLKKATQVAILNANYIAKKLEKHFPVLYKAKNGFVAHECIIDCRDLKTKTGIDVGDIAKRLMDYGFHAPTVSWPVPGTIMIEPTESESKDELDRFCNAMIAIREEILKVENGEWPKDNNPVINAPHTSSMIATDDWNFPYSREVAVFPSDFVKNHKFWPAVSKIDNAYGDKNFICTCPSVSDFS